MKLKWAILKEEDVEKFKADLRGHTGSINLLLSSCQLYVTPTPNVWTTPTLLLTFCQARCYYPKCKTRSRAEEPRGTGSTLHQPMDGLSSSNLNELGKVRSCDHATSETMLT